LKISVTVILGAILVIFAGCSPSQKEKAPGKADLLDAAWITDSREIPGEDSLFYGDIPAPVFRKEFSIKKEVKSAVLFITAAGYYDASVNGIPVGKNYLDPAWTNFAKRIYYAEYDITPRLKQGENVIGATLGNGFYNPLPLNMWGKTNLRKELPVGKPSLIARLKIEYNDGTIENIITDRSWKYSYGPILKNNVYLGEVHDGSKVIPQWNLTGFDDSGWEKPVEDNGPGGQLEKAFFPHIQVTELIDPVKVTTPAKDMYIVDMGVNFTGVYNIRLKGQKGDTITFRFGERLYEDGTLNTMTSVCGQIKRKGLGGPGAPDIAWQTDSYIFGDDTDIEFSPIFTFHIYRFMEISGLKYQPELSDLQGIAFNTNVGKRGSFTCSSDLINSIQEITLRTFRDNLISVQSDCPGREKFGYGGDLNATSEAFMYNFDMQSFYRKTLYDYIDAMRDSIFIDTAPFVGIKYCNVSWESAYIITQDKLLTYYNDVEIIKKLYQSDLDWMNKVERLNPSKIIEPGIGDHESLVNVPVQLMGTTHYLECARVMQKFARIMGDKSNEEKYSKLEADLINIVLEMFWNKPVPDPINRQTLFATLLYYDIIPEDEKKAGMDSLMKAIEKAPAGHFTTGIFGTKYILETLSESGKTGQVFNIVNSTEFPGWGFMIDNGATSIWETWKESDNVYSNCHPMFGSVTEWFYRWLAGIRPDPDYPGFERFIIAPDPPQKLDYVNCSYQTHYGEIVSNWKKEGKKVIYDIRVPDGTLASVSLPVTKNQTVSIEEKTGKAAYSPEGNDGIKGRFDLKPGEYTINVTP